MTAFRALLRNGLFGVLLAYALAAQAMLAGPALAGVPQNAQHELCLNGEPMPDGAPGHDGHDCPCLSAAAFQSMILLPVQTAFALPMRDAVPAMFARAAQPSPIGFGPGSPAARGPPVLLV